MKQWTELLKQISMLAQLGLSFMTPLLMCLALCWWICSKTGVGEWIFLFGFFFGLGGSFTVAWKFYKSVIANHRKQEKIKPKKASFNRHI